MLYDPPNAPPGLDAFQLPLFQLVLERLLLPYTLLPDGVEYPPLVLLQLRLEPALKLPLNDPPGVLALTVTLPHWLADPELDD